MAQSAASEQPKDATMTSADEVSTAASTPDASTGASDNPTPPDDVDPNAVVLIGEAAFAADQPPRIGEIIREVRRLHHTDLDRIALYQQEHGGRFGEAAVALGLADPEDVLQALARQFRYKVADREERRRRPELVVLNQPFSAQAEAFRAVRSQYLLRTKTHSERRALAVISPSRGDGRSFFTANLACALAQLSGRVLVLDANLRTPRLHEIFNVDNGNGLSSVLSGRGNRGVIQPVTGLENLFVMPVGLRRPILSS